MKTSTLKKKIGHLSTDQKLKVEGYVDVLLKIKKCPVPEKNIEIRTGFGGGKGLIAYTADDFYAPLDDFKDQMP